MYTEPEDSTSFYGLPYGFYFIFYTKMQCEFMITRITLHIPYTHTEKEHTFIVIKVLRKLIKFYDRVDKLFLINRYFCVIQYILNVPEN